MFKAVNNLREQKGFTLIELLIVIAIIGILAAIAIPAFLGQREKAKKRSMEGSARGMLSEIQARLDDYVLGQPMIFLDATGTQRCYHHTDITQTSTDKNACYTVYKMAHDGTYDDLDDIMAWALTEHNDGKSEVSPFTGQPLVTWATANCTNATTLGGTAANYGKVVLCNSTDDTVFIYGFSRDGTEAIYETVVSAR